MTQFDKYLLFSVSLLINRHWLSKLADKLPKSVSEDWGNTLKRWGKKNEDISHRTAMG